VFRAAGGGRSLTATADFLTVCAIRLSMAGRPGSRPSALAYRVG
jgi:hypothetical protein